MCAHRKTNGEGGIRTPDTGLNQYNGLANRRLQPLGHLSRVYICMSAARIVRLEPDNQTGGAVFVDLFDPGRAFWVKSVKVPSGSRTSAGDQTR